MPQDKLPVPQFAAKIKAKYPQYKDIDDTVLVQKILAKYPEYNDQVDMTGIVKKKGGTDLSMVGGKAVPDGGQVGRSAPLSEREKIANYVKTLGGGVKQVSGDKTVGNLKAITQTKATEKPETTFDQTKEEAVSGGINKINEIMYDTNDDWKDPIKVSLEKSVDRTQGNKSNLEYLAANVITRDAILKSGYNASKMLQTTPIWAMAKPGENMTADLLKQKTAEFKNKVQPFEGIELNELDNGEGGGNDEFYKYVYGDKIYNAAIKAHALKNPNFKDQLLAKGATYEDFENGDLMKFVPSGKLGQIVSESVYDPDVAEYLKNEKPYLFNGLKAIASSLIEDDKDFGANVVANKISREFLKKRKLNPLQYVADFATQGLKDEINEFAKANLTEQEYRVYQNRILGNEERYLDTPSLLEGFASGGKQIFSGIKSTFTTPFKSQSEIIDEGWKQEASNVSADPEGMLKFLRDSGHTLGIVGGIASLGGPLGGGGTGFYATKVVPALSGTIPFLGDMLQEGTMKYPDSPVKAWTSAMFNTALYAALSYRIFPAKDVEKAFTAVKPEIAVVVKNLTNGSITREVARKEMNTIAVKALNFLSGTQIKSGKIAAELTGISALNQMLDKVMGMDDKTYEKYHPEGELSDTFGSLFLSNQFVGGLAKYGEMKRGNRIVEASLYEAASNPLKFQREVELLKTKDESIDTNQILDNLKFLTEVKKELDARGIKPANQGRYMFEAMKEKVFADAVKSTPDSNMIRPMKESIKRGEEIKASILEGEDVVGNEQFELQKENKALSADQIAIQKALEGKEIKDTLFASIAESAMKDPELAAQLVADIKSQATGEVAGEIGSAKSGQINSFGEGLVEYAINKKAGEPERPKVEAGSVGVGGDVKQKDLENRIDDINKKRTALRGEDGVVPADKMGEWNRLGKELKEAKVAASRGNSKSSILIKKRGESETSDPTHLSKEEKEEAADLIEQVIQNSKTVDEAVKKVNRLGYVFDLANANLFALYLSDRYNSDAPQVGNNKSSFQDWVNGKQSLKETPTPKGNTSNEGGEAGSVGVGGDVPTSLRGVKYSDIIVGDKHLEDILSDNKLSEDEKQQVREIFARGVDYFKFDKEGEKKFQEKFSNPEDITDVADIMTGVSAAQQSAFNFHNTKNYDNVKDAVNYIANNPNDYSPKVVKAVKEIKEKLDNPSSSMNRLYAIDVMKELGIAEQSLKEQPKSDIDAKKEAIETEKQQAITEATKPVVDLELLGDEQQTIDLITEKASGDKDGGKAKIRQHERIRARLQALKDLIDCV